MSKSLEALLSWTEAMPGYSTAEPLLYNVLINRSSCKNSFLETNVTFLLIASD